MKKIRSLVVYTFVLSGFILLAHSAEASCPGELGFGDTIPSVWTKGCSPYVIKNIIQASDSVTIEPGVVVKFKYAASATFNNTLTAIGTEEEKIVFTAYTDDEHDGDTNGDLDSTTPKVGYWYQILIGSSATAHFENTSFLYGGEHPWGTLSLQPNLKNSVTIKTSEFKHNKYAGIYTNYNPDQIIQNNIFSNNGEGIVLNDCYHNLSAKISGNSFEDNINFGAKVNYPNYNTLDARDNWWGDTSGPYHSILNPSGVGDKVSNGVLFDPWTGKGGFVPVVIIPGIMGSWEKDEKWEIDPIFHIYDNLYEEFQNEKYIPEKDLFTFPYEWRDSNKVNAVELRAKIQEIKDQTHFPKVDIVAHSMGGLLAREYIESNYYNDDISNLITVGTPHLGAPKDYVTWEAGEFLGPWSSAIKRIFTLEALEEGFINVHQYIRNRPIISVQELLPVYNYLYDVQNNYTLRESYPNNYPRNEFLEDLNNPTRVRLLENVEFAKVTGKMNDDQSTIAGYNVTNNSYSPLWEYGYPKNFYIPVIGDSGIRYDDGDQTVPLYSAEATEIPNDKTIYLESEHNELPTDAQKDILEILTGHRPVSEVTKWHMPNILIILVHSPVDIQIFSPNGQRLGKNFETGEEFNEIEGAFYTGSDTKSEFITIPNPEEGEYKIFTQGTGEGEYKIEVAKITEDENDPQGAQESTATITGTAETGKIEEAKIEVSENEVVYNPDTTPPILSDGLPTGELVDAVTETQISLTTDEKATCKYSTEPDIPFDSMTESFTTADGLAHTAQVLGLEQYKTYNFFAKCRDENGNTNTDDYLISFSIPDKIPPTATGAVITLPNSNGWYNADVTVEFSCEDSMSGPKVSHFEEEISTEGENQSASWICEDLAGNVSETIVSGINIDKTKPAISVKSPQNKNYLNNQILDFDYQIADDMSGLESAEKLLDGKAFNEKTLDLSLEHLGSHAFKITAVDLAGNSAEKNIDFSIATSLDAIRTNVNHYRELDLINTKSEQLYLLFKLDQLKEIFSWLSQVENSNLGLVAKTFLTNIIKKAINLSINQLVYHINHATSQLIDAQAAELLIEDLNLIRP